MFNTRFFFKNYSVDNQQLDVINIDIDSHIRELFESKRKDSNISKY